MTKKELENYIPKGGLEGFPKEIIAKMLDCQEEQGNKKDISVFEEDRTSYDKGFLWNKTEEGSWFWDTVIDKRNFDLFFEKYPKKEDNQEFRVGDKVYDIMHKSIGVVIGVIKDNTSYSLEVYLENARKEVYTKNGRICYYLKTPQLFHYRDDYDYSIIDFNNPPKRQEPKRWRAEIDGMYYYIYMLDNKLKLAVCVEQFMEFDNEKYNSGNYFKTKEEVLDKVKQLNEQLKQIINNNK